MAGVLEHVVGPWGAVVINVALVVSVLGAFLSWTLLAAEVPYVAARDGTMPRFLGGKPTWRPGGLALDHQRPGPALPHRHAFRTQYIPGVVLHRLCHDFGVTPENCKALLFDDVLWVKKARQEHDAFVDSLRARGVTVLDFGTLLGETVVIPEARRWLLDRRVKRTQPALVPALRSQLMTRALT
jgi:hypothetical protein